MIAKANGQRPISMPTAAGADQSIDDIREDYRVHAGPFYVDPAIRLKEPEMFGHRRPFAIDGGPPALNDPARPWDAPKDVLFSDIALTVGPRRVALWTLAYAAAASLTDRSIYVDAVLGAGVPAPPGTTVEPGEGP